MKTKIILLVMLSLLLVGCEPNKNQTTDESEWNNGICSDCGGELRYTKTGSKEHYICEKCGKEYTFDRVMSRRTNNGKS